MYNIWFCEIYDCDADNYLMLSYEKLIYENVPKDAIVRHCTGLEKEWGNDFIFDRIDHDEYVRFKNNDKYCLFLEEVLLNSFIDDEDKYVDFLTLDKDAFLKSYSYLTEEEYNDSAIDYVNDTLTRYTDDESGKNSKDFYLAMTDNQKIELFENTKDVNKDIDDFETDLVVCFDYGCFH